MLNEGMMEDVVGKKYTGVIGRRYDPQWPGGKGMIDLHELDKPILKEQHPWWLISRDEEWDPHHEKDWEHYKWFPKKNGWCISLVESWPYDDDWGSGLAFARWLPSPIQPYMKFIARSRIAREHWNTSKINGPVTGFTMTNGGKEYVNAIEKVANLSGGAETYDGHTHLISKFKHGSYTGLRNMRTEQVTGPMYLTEAAQDLLLWHQGQFLHHMYHHHAYRSPEALYDDISKHFIKIVKTSLPDRYYEITVGELEQVDTQFEMFCQVFALRLSKNLQAMEHQHWSAERYGNQPEIVVPGYKSKTGTLEPEEYGKFEDPHTFLKDHQSGIASPVDTPWEHI